MLVFLEKVISQTGTIHTMQVHGCGAGMDEPIDFIHVVFIIKKTPTGLGGKAPLHHRSK